jgi:hypothetical protein
MSSNDREPVRSLATYATALPALIDGAVTGKSMLEPIRREFHRPAA